MIKKKMTINICSVIKEFQNSEASRFDSHRRSLIVYFYAFVKNALTLKLIL